MKYKLKQLQETTLLKHPICNYKAVVKMDFLVFPQKR
jgi:hypothetical protein